MLFCLLALVLFVWLKPLRYVAPANYPQKVYSKEIPAESLAEWEKFKPKCGKSCKVEWNGYVGIPGDIEWINYKTNTTVTDDETALRIAKEFISEISELYKINPEDLGEFRVRGHKHRTNKTSWSAGVSQRYRGISIFPRAGLGMSISQDGRITSFGGNYYPDISIPSTPRIPRFLAVAIAFGEVFPRAVQVSIPLLLKDMRIGLALVIFPLYPLVEIFNADTDDIYVHIQEKDGFFEYRLIWIIRLHHYEAYIDAITGEVIREGTTVIIM